jgi:hypothetical protein
MCHLVVPLADREGASSCLAIKTTHGSFDSAWAVKLVIPSSAVPSFTILPSELRMPRPGSVVCQRSCCPSPLESPAPIPTLHLHRAPCYCSFISPSLRQSLAQRFNWIIKRIRTFLKETYPREPELPTADGNELYKGLEYRFLKPYVDTNTQDEHDNDQ